MKHAHVNKMLFGSLLCLLLVLPAAAQGPELLAKVENLGDGLLFTPTTEFRQLILLRNLHHLKI